MKRCKSCGQDKPLEQFGTSKRSADGRSSRCRECVAADSRKRYAANREEKLAQNRAWYYANKAARSAQIAAYRAEHPEIARKSARRYRARNVEKVSAYGKAYFQANRERFREWAKQSRQRRPERRRAEFHSWRARAAGVSGSFTEAEWLALLDACNWSCVRCGRHVSDLESIYPGREIALEVDHIVPLSRGGSGAIDNIQPLCSGCNNQKRARSEDYRPPEVKERFVCFPTRAA